MVENLAAENSIEFKNQSTPEVDIESERQTIAKYLGLSGVETNSEMLDVLEKRINSYVEADSKKIQVDLSSEDDWDECWEDEKFGAGVPISSYKIIPITFVRLKHMISLVEAIVVLADEQTGRVHLTHAIPKLVFSIIELLKSINHEEYCLYCFILSICFEQKRNRVPIDDVRNFYTLHENDLRNCPLDLHKHKNCMHRRGGDNFANINGKIERCSMPLGDLLKSFEQNLQSLFDRNVVSKCENEHISVF
jgi:hypothetical protein